MIIPISDMILVEEIESEDKIGSLYIPSKHKEAPIRAKVIAAGDGRWEKDTFVPNPVKAGDVIFFVRHSGLPVSYSGKDYLLIKQINIFGIEHE